MMEQETRHPEQILHYLRELLDEAEDPTYDLAELGL